MTGSISYCSFTGIFIPTQTHNNTAVFRFLFLYGFQTYLLEGRPTMLENANFEMEFGGPGRRILALTCA